MKSFLLLLRPHQWVKNLFIFLPLFFVGRIFDTTLLWPALLACCAFCLLSSGIYCLNDILDYKSDRLHPRKCQRPIASGAVSKAQGFCLMSLCWIAAALLVFGVDHLDQPISEHRHPILPLLLVYWVLNVAYCLRLKHIAILDVFIISFGFVLRILTGGFSTGVWLSHWIILMTLLLALFLAFAKRRDDVLIYEKTGVKARANVTRYNKPFLDHVITLLTGITVVAYILYTVSPDVTERFHSQYVYVTALFVLMGMLRYLQITFVDERSGSPSKILLRDRFLQLCILGWIATFALILYF